MTNTPIFSLGENCITTDYTSILDLGVQPWGNDFLATNNNTNQKKYPLHLVYCNKSDLLQLNYFVPKETMFKNHTYITTPALNKEFLKIAQENKKQFDLQPNDTILDIGGNDGSQLLQYKSIGLNNVINFESADNIAQLSEKNNIRTINRFFNLKNVEATIAPCSIKLINASGVFFHLEELHSACQAIQYCLQDSGILVIQFMYAGMMIEKNNFDMIYHEHLCYYTLHSLCKMLDKYDLYLEDAYFTELHSGSIVAKFRKKNINQTFTPQTDRAKKQLNIDKKYTKDAFIQFGQNIQKRQPLLKRFLEELKKNGKSIYGYGAPVKGNTLLNFTQVDNTIIDKLVEINPLKIGTYAPGSNIPVVKESENDIPDYYLLLAHNFVDEIMAKKTNKNVKFIVPFPEIEIK